jgi:hypothetical protein
MARASMRGAIPAPERDMKLIITAVAFATLASGFAAAADARPHHRTCKWVYRHHHKVKKCW